VRSRVIGERSGHGGYMEEGWMMISLVVYDVVARDVPRPISEKVYEVCVVLSSSRVGLPLCLVVALHCLSLFS
jgi:hypothetical protein